MISLLVHIMIYVVIFSLFNCIQEQFTAYKKYLTNQKVWYIVYILHLHEMLPLLLLLAGLA